MTHIFSVIRKDGKQEFFKANSANHAKQMRSRIIREQPLFISPITNMSNSAKPLSVTYGITLKRPKVNINGIA